MTKPRSKNVSPNKISDDEQRRAENIKQRLQNQGIGQDEAQERSLEMAAKEGKGGKGGGKHSGGGAQSRGGS